MAAFALLFAAIMFFVRGDYSFVGASNALFIPGFLLIGFIGLSLIGRTGTYDIVSYGFVRLRDSLRREKVKSFEDAYAYSEYKREQRVRHGSYALPYFVIGGLFIALAALFAFI